MRVRALHGDHFPTRESLLPGASTPAPSIGPTGGAAVALDTVASVEVKWLDPTRWEFVFNGEGAVVPALPDASRLLHAYGNGMRPPQAGWNVVSTRWSCASES